MKINHVYRRETYGDNVGRQIAVTQVQYEGPDGEPMAASLHGHLHEQTVRNSIKAFRASDARIAR